MLYVVKETRRTERLYRVRNSKPPRRGVTQMRDIFYPKMEKIRKSESDIMLYQTNSFVGGFLSMSCTESFRCDLTMTFTRFDCAR